MGISSIRLIRLHLVLLACSAVLMTAPAVMATGAEGCAADVIDIQTAGDPVRFRIEIADTDSARARGLMHREQMDPDQGMLFVYDRPSETAFWMKNTPLPLDIIFMNRRGVICSIAADTVPYSLDHIPSGCAAQTVLEVNAGQAVAMGLRVGAPARHSRILDPLWPCE